MFGEKAGLTMPVTEMARAEARIRIKPAPSRRAAVGPPDARLATLRP
jgi:hypothetical protein